MTQKGALRDRERALEDCFFADENQRALERLRKVKLAEVDRKDLSEVTGIANDQVLNRLLDANVRAETLAAFTLVPLVRVAWATGRVQGPAREAVLQAAEERGIPQDGDTYRLLRHWLTEHPAKRLYHVWDEYAQALCAALPEQERDNLRHDILTRAREVAASARHFAGIGPKVSREEREVLDQIEAALTT